MLWQYTKNGAHIKLSVLNLVFSWIFQTLHSGLDLRQQGFSNLGMVQIVGIVNNIIDDSFSSASMPQLSEKWRT